MPRENAHVLVIALALSAFLASLPGPGEAALIDYFIVQYPSISPNGDGIKDESVVRLGLLDTCAVLLLAVEDRSSGAPLDTLISAADVVPGVYTAEWRGRSAAGGLLADGGYTLRVRASGAGETEDITRMVIVDTTAPLVVLDRIEPGIYTPDLAGTPGKALIYFSISYSGAGDTMSVTITNPLETEYRLPVEIQGDGAYRAEWSAPAPAVDSLHSIDLVITDEAGNSGAARGFFDVDTKAPQLAFLTELPNPTNRPPLVIEGRCYDRNGIERDSISWDGSRFFIPDSTYLIDGTVLVWRFDAADSLWNGSAYDEGKHTIRMKCRDRVGHASEISRTFRLDLTAPGAPAMNAPPSTVFEPMLNITGTIGGADLKYIHLYRAAGNDTDRTRAELVRNATTFFVTDTLSLGGNTFWAATQDSAGNMSMRSNTCAVTYQIAAGISHPEVFRGPDVFHVYTERTARKITLTIFTVSGELVATILSGAPGTDFSLPWDLTTTDGEVVRNGPYLVVVAIDFGNETRVEKRFIAVVR